MKKETFIFGFIGLIILVVWLRFFNNYPERLKDLDVLFAALSFLGVIWAVVVQKEELKLQREELESTRKVFNEQSSTSRKQRFENSFFQLINVHVERERSIDYHNKVGSQIFHKLIEDQSMNMGASSLLEHAKYDQYEQKIKESYKSKRDTAELNTFRTHFNNTFLILEFIQRSKLIDENEKSFYFDILKSQLSKNELYLLKLESHYREGFAHVDFYDIFKDAVHPNLPKQPAPFVSFIK